MPETPVIRRRQGHASGRWPDDFPPLLRRLHAARGAGGPEDAAPKLAQLLPPGGLSNIDVAVRLLAEAIDQQRHILIVGDFDCDGATACAVGVRGLRMLGATRVSHAVPNRMVHGYGLSPALVDELAALQPDLLVTVDHGIACHAGITAAKARGWQVLVTDHHLPGETLPPADAIVDPNLPGDGFGSKMLAGVGVMFYVLLALRAHLRDAGRLPSPVPDLSALLDLVAVGTVADLVPLDTNNRALVGAGLRRLRAGQGCAGLVALAEVSGCRLQTLGSMDIGFRLAPRINAAGRLEDMALGIECLLCDDPHQARELAEVLHGINAERQGLQQHMVEEAEAMLPALDTAGPLPAALCVHDAQWHPGVVGLVASKLKERAHRPVIAFAPGEPGGDSLRGSARSIPGLHIRDALAAVDCAHPGLIDRFGGHAMAAGLSLPAAALPAFQAAWLAQVEAMLDPALLRAELLSDGELAANEFDRLHAELLRDGGPWGQGYPEPLFDGVFDVVGTRIVGERHLKLRLRNGAQLIDAIHFGGAQAESTNPRQRIAYRLTPDDYRGGDAVQLVVVHREPA
jgi:single-stranded-DNA-specific exonuclease